MPALFAAASRRDEMVPVGTAGMASVVIMVAPAFESAKSWAGVRGLVCVNVTTPLSGAPSDVTIMPAPERTGTRFKDELITMEVRYVSFAFEAGLMVMATSPFWLNWDVCATDTITIWPDRAPVWSIIACRSAAPTSSADWIGTTSLNVRPNDSDACRSGENRVCMSESVIGICERKLHVPSVHVTDVGAMLALRRALVACCVVMTVELKLNDPSNTGADEFTESATGPTVLVT